MRRFSSIGAVFSFASLSALGFLGCSQAFQPSAGSGPSGAAGAAGADGADGADSGEPNSDAGTTPPGTTPPKPAPSCTPKPGADDPDDGFEDSNCDGIDGDLERAVFVSTGGSDEASGSVNEPVATLKKAIEIAASSEKHVYVCNGTYVENVVLAAKNARIFGGYACKSGWQRGSEHAVVAPTGGIPLGVSGVTKASFEAIDFVAPDAVSPSGSSIAATVDKSSGVSFHRSLLDAGRGANAAAGAAGEVSTAALPVAAAGTGVGVASCTNLAAPWPGSVCASNAAGGKNTAVSPCDGNAFGAVGGKGGNGGNQYYGIVATSGTTPFQGGAGGTATANGGSVGAPGAAGESGTTGAAGGVIGKVENGMYVASNAGGDGTNGKFGRGGGGGSGGWSSLVCSDVCSTFVPGSGGGQGGYGGCGGKSGKGGGAGGASIALLIVDSQVDISSSTLATSDGGTGGAAGKGGAGQPGGAAGKGGAHKSLNAKYIGKSGGAGGKGGDGGAGGPGGGGASVAILVSGAWQPTTVSVDFELGLPGQGGAAVTGNAGATGLCATVSTL